MKNKHMQLVFAGLFMFAAAVPAFAQEASVDEKKLDKVEADLNKNAAEPEGQAVVTEKIKSDFKVDDARISGLQAQGLSHGGITAALALAQGLPGGITDENVQKVVALRQGPPVMGWGKVAKDLGLKLGPAISKAKKTGDAAGKKVKAEKMKKEKKEKAEKMRNEKKERAGKADRPAKGGKGGGGKK